MAKHLGHDTVPEIVSLGLRGKRPPLLHVYPFLSADGALSRP